MALLLHASRDSRQHTAPARAAFLARFEREVDPEGVLSPDERARRAQLRRRAYFVELAGKSARKRAEGKNKRATAVVPNGNRPLEVGDEATIAAPPA